jgi:hypothetical protein
MSGKIRVLVAVLLRDGGPAEEIRNSLETKIPDVESKTRSKRDPVKRFGRYD